MTVSLEPPYTIKENELAALLAKVAPLDQMHWVMSLPLARFLLNDDLIADFLRRSW